MRRLLLTLVVLAVAVTIPAAAYAQTYPTGSTTTTAPSGSSAFINVGTLGPGGSIAVDVCGFLGNSTVTVSVGSVSGQGKVASNGCGTLAIKVIDPGSTALGRPVFAAVGMQLAAAHGSQLSINGKVVTGSEPGTATLITVKGTGSNDQPRVVTVSVTTSTSGGTGLPRTGADVLRWSALGVELIVAGALLLVARRRRKLTPTA